MLIHTALLLLTGSVAARCAVAHENRRQRKEDHVVVSRVLKGTHVAHLQCVMTVRPSGEAAGDSVTLCWMLACAAHQRFAVIVIVHLSLWMHS